MTQLVDVYRPSQNGGESTEMIDFRFLIGRLLCVDDVNFRFGRFSNSLCKTRDLFQHKLNNTKSTLGQLEITTNRFGQLEGLAWHNLNHTWFFYNTQKSYVKKKTEQEQEKKNIGPS